MVSGSLQVEVELVPHLKRDCLQSADEFRGRSSRAANAWRQRGTSAAVVDGSSGGGEPRRDATRPERERAPHSPAPGGDRGSEPWLRTPPFCLARSGAKDVSAPLCTCWSREVLSNFQLPSSTGTAFAWLEVVRRASTKTFNSAPASARSGPAWSDVWTRVRGGRPFRPGDLARGKPVDVRSLGYPRGRWTRLPLIQGNPTPRSVPHAANLARSSFYSGWIL